MTAALNITQPMLELMAEQPRTAIELANILGCASTTVGQRLRRLEIIKQAHRTHVRTSNGSHFLWHAGAAGSCVVPLAYVATLVAEGKSQGVDYPRQRTITAYTINTPRDPMIAALFGPARREAA